MATTFQEVIDAIRHRYSCQAWWRLLPKERTAIIYQEMRRLDAESALASRIMRESIMKHIVVIGASEGGLKPLCLIIEAIAAPCAAAVFVVMHIGSHQSVLPSLLNRSPGLPAEFGQHDAVIQPGHIYVAPRDHHMLLTLTGIRLSRKPKLHYTRPAIDPLFISAAESHGQRVIGIILSGGGSDGTAGLRAIKECGGMALVQRPEEAAMPSMPQAAIAMDSPETLLVEEIAQRVGAFCS